jgi:hypothetical protein
MIRHVTRISLAAAATTVAALAPAAAAQASQHCHPHGSVGIVANRFARAYARTGSVYVCIKSSGKTTKLKGANPAYPVALGGKWVGWSSDQPGGGVPNSTVTVMHIPNRSVNKYWYPFQTNETVDEIVVLSDGATAWAITPQDGGDGNYTIVQGTDRMNHPPDQFSDDHTDLVGTSLHQTGPKTVSWKYTDGTTGSQTLY